MSKQYLLGNPLGILALLAAHVWFELWIRLDDLDLPCCAKKHRKMYTKKYHLSLTRPIRVGRTTTPKRQLGKPDVSFRLYSVFDSNI